MIARATKTVNKEITVGRLSQQKNERVKSIAKANGNGNQSAIETTTRE
jgi:hypothetical protein